MAERKLLVPPYGSSDAPIALVGEAPGREEAQALKPFIGQAGQLLTQFLAAAGLSRAQCCIYNVIMEKPPNNDITKFIKLDRGGVVKQHPDYAFYENLLHKYLADSNHNILVPLGNVSLWALTRRHPITTWRGSMIESVPLGKSGKIIKVLPTFHPASAFSFRNYTNRYLIVSDFLKVKEVMDYPELRYKPRTLHLRPTFLEARSFLERCCKAKEVGFDIEMSLRSREITCISFALSANEVMSIPFSHKGNEHYMTFDQETEIWQLIGQLLEDESIIKLGQNLSFDVCHIFSHYGILTKNIRDTMVAQGIANPDFPKALEFTTSLYTDIPYYKKDGKTFVSLRDPDDRFWRYNALDSIVLFEIDGQLQLDLMKQRNEETYDQAIKLIEPLIYMQLRGIRTDRDAMKAASKKLEKELKDLQIELELLCGQPLNANSWKQVANYFYIKKRITPYRKRGKKGSPGAITTDDTAMTRLMRKGHKEANLILQIRGKSKMKSTYVDMPLDEDGRLRGSYNPVGTKTGRLSSSQTIFGMGGNQQNIPKEHRRFMKADPGYILYGPDLSQAEDRVVSMIGPEPVKAKAYEVGWDTHKLTASLMLNIEYDEVSSDPYSAGLPNSDKSQRDIGKTCNHALNYGLGAEKLSLKYGLPKDYADYVRAKYYEVYPGVVQYHNWIQEKLRRDRAITNCYGRTRTFLETWGDDLFRDAYSFIPQSTVADKINREGIIPLYYDRCFRNVELLAQIHDAI